MKIVILRDSNPDRQDAENQITEVPVTSGNDQFGYASPTWWEWVPLSEYISPSEKVVLDLDLSTVYDYTAGQIQAEIEIKTWLYNPQTYNFLHSTSAATL